MIESSLNRLQNRANFSFRILSFYSSLSWKYQSIQSILIIDSKPNRVFVLCATQCSFSSPEEMERNARK